LALAPARLRVPLRGGGRLPRLEHARDLTAAARGGGAPARADHGAVVDRLPGPTAVREPGRRRDCRRRGGAGRGTGPRAARARSSGAGLGAFASLRVKRKDERERREGAGCTDEEAHGSTVGAHCGVAVTRT